MTDRELLELAAKAAGLKVNTRKQAERVARGNGAVGLWTAEKTCWNPLTDDGDAFQLVVELRLFVDVTAEASGAGGQGCKWCSELHGDDPYAATRRAIVRAAAEIGRAMG